MFISFVEALRKGGIPASLKEHLLLLEALDPQVRAALELAIENVGAVARAGLGEDVDVALPQGQQVRLRELPVGRAAIVAFLLVGPLVDKSLETAIARQEIDRYRIACRGPQTPVATMSGGKPAGPPNPAHAATENPGRRAPSSTVGTSGKRALRRAEVTAIGRTLPPSIKPCTEPMLAV